MDERLAAITRLLAGLPGVVTVTALDDALRERIRQGEREYERGSLLPVRNLGIEPILRMGAALVILKTGEFRPPPAPTVYLVEDDPPADDPFRIVVQDRAYRVIGREVFNDEAAIDEQIVSVSDSFVIFPARRRGARVPCSFIVPPLPFPELASRQDELGIAHPLSVSPSIAVDSLLRTALSLPPSNRFATILLGFDLI